MGIRGMDGRSIFRELGNTSWFTVGIPDGDVEECACQSTLPFYRSCAPTPLMKGVDDLVLRDVGELIVLVGEALDVVAELFLALALAIA